MRTERRTKTGWIAAAATTLLTVGLLAALPATSQGAPTGESDALERADEAVGSQVDGDRRAKRSEQSQRHQTDGASIYVNGVHSVASSVERYMARDIARKLRLEHAAFSRCWSRHARGADPDRRITVDFTVTTDGIPVGVTVFTKHERAKSCIKSVIRGKSFKAAPDRHPRARVELYF